MPRLPLPYLQVVRPQIDVFAQSGAPESRQGPGLMQELMPRVATVPLLLRVRRSYGGQGQQAGSKGRQMHKHHNLKCAVHGSAPSCL